MRKSILKAKIILSMTATILIVFMIILSYMMIQSYHRPIKYPLLKNVFNKTIIETINEDDFMHASYAIISQQNVMILSDPAFMSKSFLLNPDIITVSHRHIDHYDKDFVDRTHAIKLIMNSSSVNYKNITIYGIAANHAGFFHFNNPDIFDKNDSDNYIYVYEVDGLRIAHFGDTGQDNLTQEQRAELGDIDIMITKFNNPVMTFFCSGDKRVFRLIKEVNPKIIIPTHTTRKCLEEYAQRFGSLETVDDVFLISKEDIRNDTRKIIYIKNNIKY